MAEQPKHDRAWDFATEAYLPLEDDGTTIENRPVPVASDVGDLTSPDALPGAGASPPKADPDADSDSAT